MPSRQQHTTHRAIDMPRLAVAVVLPTPPLPEVTTITRLSGVSSFSPSPSLNLTGGSGRRLGSRPGRSGAGAGACWLCCGACARAAHAERGKGHGGGRGRMPDFGLAAGCLLNIKCTSNTSMALKSCLPGGEERRWVAQMLPAQHACQQGTYALLACMHCLLLSTPLYMHSYDWLQTSGWPVNEKCAPVRSRPTGRSLGGPSPALTAFYGVQKSPSVRGAP